ncbi:hypothetical protein SDC9_190458 [bioreactor metagenome]|uniref:Uncharacterized protein n=1 Tax=bioreactor metagenome TaxID=1076179 RepID=A0A645HVL9_9ZZZZ
MPAIKTPLAIMGKHFLIRMSVRAAISAPVHAPVPGNGIATNISKPQSRQRFTLSLCRIERISSFSMSFEKPFLLRKNWKILRINNNINGTGIMLPI